MNFRILIIAMAWFVAGASLGFIVAERLERGRGLIVCTGYQKAYIEHITIDGKNLFVGVRTLQQVADDIAKVVCRDTGI